MYSGKERTNGNEADRVEIMAISTVTPEQFVHAWQAADSVKAVMKATGLSYTAVSRRVSDYRNKGVNLKKLTHPRRTINVDALNKICESIDENKQ